MCDREVRKKETRARENVSTRSPPLSLSLTHDNREANGDLNDSALKNRVRAIVQARRRRDFFAVSEGGIRANVTTRSITCVVDT